MLHGHAPWRSADVRWRPLPPIGKTLVSRIQGTKIASEGLKQSLWVSLADLQSDEDMHIGISDFVQKMCKERTCSQTFGA